MPHRTHHGMSLSPPRPVTNSMKTKGGAPLPVRSPKVLVPLFATQPQSLSQSVLAPTPSAQPTTLAANSHHGSLSFAQSLVESRGGPGVLVLSASLKLLYMNDEARELTGVMNSTLEGRKANGVLPAEIMSFCEELLRLMRVRTGPKDWEQAQLRRVSGNALGFVLLRGLGIPALTAAQEGHLIVTMEEINLRREVPAERAQSRYHLTEREQTVVIYLLKGLTNKEIACRMTITEQTVKEHVKHIMHKTNATTRTGVISQILLTPFMASGVVQDELAQDTTEVQA